MIQEIPLSMPDLSEEDIQAVVQVLRTPQLSLGPKLREFEQKFAAFVGTKEAVAVNSGTSALHLVMRGLQIRDGDEVITTPFSFIASANCILFERAKPVFVDILPSTMCIDPAKVSAAITPRTKAILAVDVFGYLADWKALRAIADKHHLLLIEDSCEAMGSERAGKRAGSFADCAVFGFYPNKQMTTGEGGMLVTDRPELAKMARSLRNQGRDDADAFLIHHRLGFNYRISDINCALGISQLKKLPEMISRRAQVARWYREGLADVPEDVHVPADQEEVNISWFVYVIRLADRYNARDRDALKQHLRDHGIGCNAYFPCIHLQPFYREAFGFKEGDFPVTEHIAERTLALPFSSRMSEKDVAKVCETLKDGLLYLPS
ncbi:MAG: DegT/DnrJ/EryC1/StrS family aminotransferase [Candidatus Peribacteraceae bacterium]|nr:DegT/DnrJ/EryC1/StrS family aminotransferase [Candidatus Peribacteraceae bacterium]